jgi:hypothetical protein
VIGAVGQPRRVTHLHHQRHLPAAFDHAPATHQHQVVTGQFVPHRRQRIDLHLQHAAAGRQPGAHLRREGLARDHPLGLATAAKATRPRELLVDAVAVRRNEADGNPIGKRPQQLTQRPQAGKRKSSRCRTNAAPVIAAS